MLTLGMVFLEMFLLEAVGGLRLFLDVNTKNILTGNLTYVVCLVLWHLRDVSNVTSCVINIIKWNYDGAWLLLKSFSKCQIKTSLFWVCCGWCCEMQRCN